jgi:signal transduction histidine kinase
MSSNPPKSRSSPADLLSKVTRYEALFELTGLINAASDIESVGGVLARRLKYITDVSSWRYVHLDRGPAKPGGQERLAIIIDADQGRSNLTRTAPDAISSFEMELWRDRKTRILDRPSAVEALKHLPSPFRKDDIEQIAVNTLVENGEIEALFLFCRRRRPFTDLDTKCLTMVSGFFHRKIHTLWEQQKLRDLEQAYLKQEVTLRQNEKLATLGRLSAGMAHELNNPAAAARRGAEQLKTSIVRLERAQYALGASPLPAKTRELLARLQEEAPARAKEASSLDPLARSDLEQEMEDWLGGSKVPEPWEHASALVTMGLTPAKLEDLTRDVDPALRLLVIECLSSKFNAYTLLEEIGHGARRVSAIVGALKGYSYMDQAPVQSVDVREGLHDTLVILGGRLRDGINLELDFAQDLPRIQAYGSELNQVWTNLIDNAISAMQGRGTLGLKAYPDDDWIVVEVADTGPGIPIEIQGKIFDPFFTTKAPGEGTGLGLSISHGIIVEKHQGQISVESQPGATRFTVKLPLGRRPSLPVEDREAPSRPP